MACTRCGLLFTNYRHVLFTFEYHFNPNFWIAASSSASCCLACSTITHCLQGQHLCCPYQHRLCQCLTGGFHLSFCHFSLSSLFFISSAFPDKRPTHHRCFKLARAASNHSTDPRRWSHSCHLASRVHCQGLFLLTSPTCCLFPSPPPFQMKALWLLYWTQMIREGKGRNDNNGKPWTWMPRIGTSIITTTQIIPGS